MGINMDMRAGWLLAKATNKGCTSKELAALSAKTMPTAASASELRLTRYPRAVGWSNPRPSAKALQAMSRWASTLNGTSRDVESLRTSDPANSRTERCFENPKSHDHDENASKNQEH